MLKLIPLLVASLSLASVTGCSTTPSPAVNVHPPPIPANLLIRCPDLDPIRCPDALMVPCADDLTAKCPGVKCLAATLVHVAGRYYWCQAQHSGLSDTVSNRQKKEEP